MSPDNNEVTIPTSSLAKGLVYYRVTNKGSEILKTGNFIVM
jgi:hypothetical protein